MTEMLNIALPKGRLGEKVYSLLKKAGYECPAIEDPGRKLIFENPGKGVRYFWVKPSDVAIYVERGAADLGIAVTNVPAYATDAVAQLNQFLVSCFPVKGLLDFMPLTSGTDTVFIELQYRVCTSSKSCYCYSGSHYYRQNYAKSFLNNFFHNPSPFQEITIIITDSILSNMHTSGLSLVFMWF